MTALTEQNKKLKELVALQEIFISYFKKYSGESERITRFSELITAKKKEFAELEKQISGEIGKNKRTKDIIDYIIKLDVKGNTSLNNELALVEIQKEFKKFSLFKESESITSTDTIIK